MVRPHPSSALSFVKNIGQWQEPFLYKTNVPNGEIFLEKNGISYTFISPKSARELHDQMHQYFSKSSNDNAQIIANYHAFRMRFKDANTNADIEEQEIQETYHNYYLGNNPSMWRSHVPLYHRLVYHDIYPKIDYEIFTANNSLKYNFIVNPDANYHSIKMQYEGCELRLEDGKLKIRTSVNELVEAEPYAYQIIQGVVVKVPCIFVLKENVVSFQVATYDLKSPLVIDPIIVFATYSGSVVDNFGFTAAFDSKENLYSAGITGVENSSGIGYPTTVGAFRKTYQGGSSRYAFVGVDNLRGWDVTISKYNATGTSLIYATYLGGNDNEYPHSLLVDYNDNLIVMGSTFSKNFPHSQSAFDTTLNDGILGGKTDIFLIKFNEAGSFLAGTYMGGNKFDGVSYNGSNSVLVYNYADEFRGDLIADKDNNYYVGSITESSNFPLKNPIQDTIRGAFDGVVFKMDSNLSNLYWSTYLGGSKEDAVYSIDLNKDNTVYVSGGTGSSDFPQTIKGFQKNYGGGETDGFIARIDNAGKQMLSATYIGTNEMDQTYFIEIDKKGNVYATGQTEGNFLVSSGKYNNPKSGQYIIKLDSTLLTKDFSTIFGSDRGGSHPDPNISPTAFLVDNCNLIYVCGWGSDLNISGAHGGSTLGMPMVFTPFPPAYSTTDGNDFYLIVFEPNCDGVRYTTFLGGDSTRDHVDGGTSRFDKRGIIYGAICASCQNNGSDPGFHSDFPTQPVNVVYKKNASQECSNVAFKLDFQLHTAIIADFRATPRIACVPQTVAMNSKSKAVHYYWDFDNDGITDDTTQSPVYTYTKAGTYKIRLICEDTNTCNRFDTSYDEVTMLDNSKAEFDLDVSYCNNTISIKNKSINQISFLWDFGDGTLDSLNSNPSHSYQATGKYSIKLFVNRNYSCSDSISKSLDFETFKPTPPIVPNVFTPNGDGKNDFFEVGGINPKCDSMEMKIYTRWGQLVFETKEVGNWWGGKNNATILPEGVYYYTLKVTNFKGDVTNKKGDVTIIR